MNNLSFKLTNFSSPLIIAIDGKAASGKGTIASRLADKYKLFHAETSIFYRQLAKLTIDNKLEELQRITDAAENYAELAKIGKAGIYDPEVTKMASKLAAIPEVRAALNIPQKQLLIEHPRIVMEGRDIGTVIAPHADIKLFITADVKERAKRRWAQWQAQGKNLSLSAIEEDLIERDQRDSSRSDAPLMAAKDAIIVDTTHLNIEQVLNFILEQINAKDSL